MIASIDREWSGDKKEGALRVMFQDEARFGRISDTQRCWCPRPIRPLTQAMVTQEYTYAYAAVSVSDGVLDTLILPPYAPELNPVEHLWDELRKKAFGNVVFDSLDALENHLEVSLKAMEQEKPIIRSIVAWPWIMNAMLKENRNNSTVSFSLMQRKPHGQGHPDPYRLTVL